VLATVLQLLLECHPNANLRLTRRRQELSGGSAEVCGADVSNKEAAKVRSIGDVENFEDQV